MVRVKSYIDRKDLDKENELSEITYKNKNPDYTNDSRNTAFVIGAKVPIEEEPSQSGNKI